MEFLFEATGTGRQFLRAKTSEITRDVMRALRGDDVGVTDLPKDAWDPDSHAGNFALGVLLGPYEWRMKIDTSEFDEEDEPEEFFNVSVNVTIDPEEEHINVSGYANAVDEEGSVIPGIDISVRLPKAIDQLTGNDLQFINNEVRNTTAHELEHLTQRYEFKAFDRDERYYSGIPTDVTGGDMFSYLMKPDEATAHVMGYAAHTKSWDELEREIESLLKGYQISGQITKQEADQVLDTWLGWAERNLMQSRFRH